METMPVTTIRRLLTAALRTPKPISALTHPSLYRCLSSSPSSPEKDPPIRTRTQTPLEKQFETWIDHLKSGFTPSQVDAALRAQPDPDLALDIFRWTSEQRNYKHTAQTYSTILQILIDSRRFRQAETIVEEILAGACAADLRLHNAAIRFCVGRRPLFNKAFDLYRKMFRSDDSKPDLETYTLLLTALLRRFDKLLICHLYLRGVRSLWTQMKSVGVIPDTFVLNMIVKAFSKCREVDEAIRVFRQMGLYGCEPNAHTYGYIAKGLCEKERVGQGFQFYLEMKERGLVPSGSTFMVLICSLAMERRLEDAVAVVSDMLDCSMSPDFLTYKTLLDEMCRAGKGDAAAELLEDFRKRDRSMGLRTYNSLLNQLQLSGGE